MSEPSSRGYSDPRCLRCMSSIIYIERTRTIASAEQLFAKAVEIQKCVTGSCDGVAKCVATTVILEDIRGLLSCPSCGWRASSDEAGLAMARELWRNLPCA
jgi:DNA-directed RNA polymerase subunit RPC12/RpoP